MSAVTQEIEQRGIAARALRMAVARIEPLRRLVRSRALEYLRRTVRAARAVREPVRFTTRQLLPGAAASYRVRDSGLQVLVRHRTQDIDIFREIFGTGYGPNSYEPPAPVAAMLEARDAPRVLDLGGNIGLFGVYLLGRWPSATLRSFEPDPANLPILKQVIDANDLAQRWQVSAVAIANAPGEMAFVSGLHAQSQLADLSAPAARDPDSADLEDGELITVRTVDLFDEDDGADLMKIDIEGGEWSILSDSRLSDLRAAAIVLEWHAIGCPEPDARAAAARLLRAAGYGGLQESDNQGHCGVLWAWRESDGAIAEGGCLPNTESGDPSASLAGQAPTR